jgi:hypothetical protein
MEGLRIYSSANGLFPRNAIQDHTLRIGEQSLRVVKDTVINTQTFPVHYKQTIYS